MFWNKVSRWTYATWARGLTFRICLARCRIARTWSWPGWRAPPRSSWGPASCGRCSWSSEEAGEGLEMNNRKPFDLSIYNFNENLGQILFVIFSIADFYSIIECLDVHSVPESSILKECGRQQLSMALLVPDVSLLTFSPSRVFFSDTHTKRPIFHQG